MTQAGKLICENNDRKTTTTRDKFKFRFPDTTWRKTK